MSGFFIKKGIRLFSVNAIFVTTIFQDAKTQKGGASKVKILLPQRLTKDIHKEHNVLLNSTLYLRAFVCTSCSLW